ncbi:MAG: hypothetical protein KJP21_08280 [Bacteroidia bacterium]|nr:hypothetical protein [Bacteroidia bacterium]NNJ54479.1 hypothetical protein [Bacteroidia bacterium]
MNTEQFFEGPGSSSMATYVWEIAFILIGAFVLGYLLRLMLNSKLKAKVSELEHDNAFLKSKSDPQPKDTSLLENTIIEQKAEIRRLNDKLSSCYAEKLKVEEKLSKQADVTPIAASSPSPKSPDKPISTKDDLKKIEGIGPKIEQILNAEGIQTFKDLADVDVAKIKEVLIAQGPTYAVHNPSTWAEQAVLANNNEWDKLDLLQKELKGGQRK